MHPTRPARTLSSAALAVFAAACADSGGPPQPVAFDPAAFEASLDALDGVVATDPWMSFGTLGALFALPTPSAEAAAIARVPVIPDTFLGSTFVYDGSGYVADPARTGAPTDGVRFVLYALQPGTPTPILDEEIATADVRDVGTTLANGFALDVAVVAPAGEVARYTASFEPGGAAPATQGALRDHDGIVLAGAIASEDDALGFEMTAGGVNGVTVTEFALSLEQGDAAVTGILGENEGTGALDFDLSVTSGGVTLRVTGSRDAGVLHATISSAAAAIATVTGSGLPAVTAAPGRELTLAQTAVLGRVAGVIDTVLELVHHTVAPVEL